MVELKLVDLCWLYCQSDWDTETCERKQLCLPPNGYNRHYQQQSARLGIKEEPWRVRQADASILKLRPREHPYPLYIYIHIYIYTYTYIYIYIFLSNEDMKQIWEDMGSGRVAAAAGLVWTRGWSLRLALLVHIKLIGVLPFIVKHGSGKHVKNGFVHGKFMEILQANCGCSIAMIPLGNRGVDWEAGGVLYSAWCFLVTRIGSGCRSEVHSRRLTWMKL